VKLLQSDEAVLENHFDLWAGTNAPAGYYVYSFMPHQKTARLPTRGSLQVSSCGDWTDVRISAWECIWTWWKPGLKSCAAKAG
jgi:hypothetical protein